MRVEGLHAIPHPDGHRIDVVWRNPDPAGFPGMRVVRRARTHPLHPGDGVIVADGLLAPDAIDDRGGAVHRVADTALNGGTVYYYSLFPSPSATPTFVIDRANRTAALATDAGDASGRMYARLPSLYRRYDAALGQLRAFLELPGAQLDLLHAFARAVGDSHDLERVDAGRLPLLAQWIGWRTDFHLEVERQRSEIRDAPSIYRRVGLLPVVGATVKRISGWESRAKEFVHNVVRSNEPPRLNLWARRLAADGTTIQTGGRADILVSVDFAYDGRPAHAVDDLGIRWMFHHTLRRGRWRIAYKTSPTFGLSADVRRALETPDIVRLQEAFLAAGFELAADATVAAAGSLWRVDDATNGAEYVVEPGPAGLTVYHISAEPLVPALEPARLATSFAPSRLLPTGGGRDEKYPSAALQGETLWLFWSSYDPVAAKWEIRYRLRRDGQWSTERDRLWELPADPIPERRAPAAVVDDAGGLWLFWLERAGSRWTLRYNRHDGTGIAVDPTTGWQLTVPTDFPGDGVEAPRVESDLFVLFHPTAAGRSLWVFWARKTAVAAGQTRWSVAYRVKSGLNPALVDWGAIETLPKSDPVVHDREPAARVDANGDIALFWSSDREGGWSIWGAVADAAAAPAAWSGIARVTGSAYEERHALPVSIGGETLLIHRSSESLIYSSEIYRAAATVDFRYAGSITTHVRDVARLGLRGEFDDFHRYTFDARTTTDDWYRRDTIGVYLVPDTVDPQAIERGIDRVANVLPEFMPATDRAVFVARPELHAEYVYTYDAPGLEAVVIAEATTATTV